MEALAPPPVAAGVPLRLPAESPPPEVGSLPAVPAGAEAMPPAGPRRRLGRGALIRAGAEVVGLGVDAALMGAGSSGVEVLQGVVAREITATAPEIAVLDRLVPAHGGEHTAKLPASRLAKLGNLALGVGTAVVAQKVGPGVVEHVASTLNHGIGEMAVPLTSKVGAMAGLSAARRSVSARRRTRTAAPRPAMASP